jgi:hypothetical protein
MVRLAFHDAGPHNVSWNPFAKGPNGKPKLSKMFFFTKKNMLEFFLLC